MEALVSQTEPAKVIDCQPMERDRIYRKIAWRLMPLLFCCYVFAYLDRVNIGFAKLQFLHDLNFDDTIYGLAAGLFFVGYVIFEVPSNLLMTRIGVRSTIMRIMVLWGGISIAMAFVTSPSHLYIARFLLGAAEAGFFPGIILYLSYWFPAEQRGRMTARFMLAIMFAGIVGNPVSGWIMGELAGTWGFKGWQMLFILEGLPPVLLAGVVWLTLVDSPAKVKWLTDREKAVVHQDLAAEPNRAGQSSTSFARVLIDPRVYVLAIAYGSMTIVTVTLALWAPTLLKSTGVAAVETIGVLMAIPYIAGGFGMILIGRSSDKLMERRWHAALSSAIAGVCLLLFPLTTESTTGTVILLSVCMAAVFGGIVVVWTIPSTYLKGTGKAGGIAFVSSLAAIGSFFGSTTVGWIKTQTGSLVLGLAGVGAIAILGAIVLVIGFPKRLLSQSDL